MPYQNTCREVLKVISEYKLDERKRQIFKELRSYSLSLVDPAPSCTLSLFYKREGVGGSTMPWREEQPTLFDRSVPGSLVPSHHAAPDQNK